MRRMIFRNFRMVFPALREAPDVWVALGCVSARG
jgi:hypothetical protein